MTYQENRYSFMDNPRENLRLAAKVDPDGLLDKYFKSHLGRASNVLDVGCGPAVITCAMADAFPRSDFVAFDISPVKIEEAKKNVAGRSNIRAELGDANGMPFGSDNFDLVFARFLFQFLPNPNQITSEMVRVCRPGGRIMIQDLDGQLVWHYPEDEGLKQKIEKALAYARSSLGFDPFVGRKLYSLLHAQGLQDIEVKAEHYHFFPGKIDEKNLELWKMKFEIIMPAIEAALGSKEAVTFRDAYLDYLLREDTLTYSMVFTVSGVKPTGTTDTTKEEFPRRFCGTNCI